jgi:hypothetical protein
LSAIIATNFPVLNNDFAEELFVFCGLHSFVFLGEMGCLGQVGMHNLGCKRPKDVDFC